MSYIVLTRGYCLTTDENNYIDHLDPKEQQEGMRLAREKAQKEREIAEEKAIQVMDLYSQKMGRKIDPKQLDKIISWCWYDFTPEQICKRLFGI